MTAGVLEIALAILALAAPAYLARLELVLSITRKRMWRTE